MKKCFLLLISFVCAFVIITAAPTTAADDRYFTPQYRHTLSSLVSRFNTVDTRRLSPLKKINRSYEDTQLAIPLLSGSQSEAAENQLINAYKRYKDNILVSLLLGTHYTDTGSLHDGAPYFQIFIQRSFTVSKIENKIMTPEERNYFRSYVVMLLEENGFDTEPKNKQITATFRIGLARLNAFPKESMTGVILFLISALGAIALIITYAFTRHSSRILSSTARLLITLYGVCVCTYFIWLVHVYLALPPLIGNSLAQEATLIISVAVITIIGLWFREKWHEKKALENDPDTFLCPLCKKPVLKLLTVCPNCKAHLDVKN